MALTTQNLAVGYNGKALLKGIDLSLPEGAFGVLIGPNGSGKSTFLRTIAGAAPPVEGEIIIAGTELRRLSPKELSRKLAMVFTDRTGGGAMTVREAVEIGRHPYTGMWGHLSADDSKMVDYAMQSVGIYEKAERYIGTLSDGERQKAMIARALAQDTPLIVLDEPTAFLDVAGRLEVLNLLKKLSREGKTILLSTHDIAPAMEAATHILAVDPAASTIVAGKKEEMINSGDINRPFYAQGMKYDTKVHDFR